MYHKIIDLSEGIDLTKINNCKECIVCHNFLYNFFVGLNFKILFLMVTLIWQCCVIHVRFMAWDNRFKLHKSYKKAKN